MMEAREDPGEYLRELGEAGDGPHDLAQAALMLSAMDHGGRIASHYFRHLKDIADHAREEGRLAGPVQDAARALAALMTGRFGYDGDRLAYDDPHNADLMAVMDRRRGLPVALGILYIHAARAGGIGAEGLNTPGHFLLRFTLHEQEAVFDPFGGDLVERERLGAPPGIVLPASGGAKPAQAISDTDVLLRLQNNLKLRAQAAQDYARAVEIAKRMALLAPRRAAIWADLAGLSEAAGELGTASRAYEAALLLAPAGNPLHNEAALALHALKRRLN